MIRKEKNRTRYETLWKPKSASVDTTVVISKGFTKNDFKGLFNMLQSVFEQKRLYCKSKEQMFCLRCSFAALDEILEIFDSMGRNCIVLFVINTVAKLREKCLMTGDEENIKCASKVIEPRGFAGYVESRNCQQ